MPTQFIFQDEITICLIAAVREFFATNPFCKDWVWSDQEEKSRITIVDSWPHQERSYPAIVLQSISTGTYEPLGFGSALERVKKNGESVGQYFGGRMAYDVTYEIGAFDKREAHRISDLLKLGLISSITSRVDETSLHNLIPDSTLVRMGGEAQRAITDQTFAFTRTLSQKWQSYWKEEVLYSPSILTYLTTAEREAIDGGTEEVQFQAD